MPKRCVLTDQSDCAVRTTMSETMHRRTGLHQWHSCGTRGVLQTPSNATISSLFSRCKRCVCLRHFQVERTPVNSDCGVVQKHAGCWWMGQPGNCRSWNILMATFIVAAGTDLLLVLIKTFLGNEHSSKSPRMQRYSCQSSSLQASQHAQVCNCIQFDRCMQAIICHGGGVHCV